MTIATDLTMASDAAVAEIARLTIALDETLTLLEAAKAQLIEDQATIAALKKQIADLEAGQPSTWSPLLGTHRRHDSGNVTGDGVDAHLAAEEVAGRLLAFRSYTEFSHGNTGVKGTTRLLALLKDPARPAYIPLHARAGGFVRWADVAAGKSDSMLAFWRDFYAANLGDRQWVWTLDHEPENDNQGTPEEYCAAYSHCVEFMNLGSYPNLRLCGAVLTDGGWQGAPMGNNANRPDPHRWYAGLEGMIDLAGGDHYSRYPDTGTKVEPLSDLAANGVKLAAELGIGYFVGESGCHAQDNASNTAKSKWIGEAQAYAVAKNFAGWQYSDVNATSPQSGRPLNYRVDSSGEVLAAWRLVCDQTYWDLV